jgi:hypothetical protein
LAIYNVVSNPPEDPIQIIKRNPLVCDDAYTAGTREADTSVNCVAYSPDGLYIAAACRENKGKLNKVVIKRVGNGDTVRTIKRK